MWRRRSLELGGGSSELEEELRKSFVGPVQRKRKERLCALSPRLIIPQHEPTWHLKPAARCGYEKVADKLSICSTGVRRCSEELEDFRGSVRYEEN